MSAVSKIGVIMAAGIATAASATTVISFQVREVGATAWATSITTQPGTPVEFRATATYVGDTLRGAQVLGFGAASLQPRVSSWDTATDVLAPFSTTAPVDLDAQYGRRNFFLSPGISTSNALRGHTNNVVSGVRYLRIAQNNVTNWTGVGPTSGSAAVNNFNGAGGVQVGQQTPTLNPVFDGSTSDVELVRFGLTLGGAENRTVVIDSAMESMLIDHTNPLRRRVLWYVAGTSLASQDDYDITINPATVTVPNPSSLLVICVASGMSCRRRQAKRARGCGVHVCHANQRTPRNLPHAVNIA